MSSIVCSIMAASFSLLYRLEFKFNDVLSIQIEGLVLPYSTNGLLLFYQEKIALNRAKTLMKFILVMSVDIKSVVAH